MSRTVKKYLYDIHYSAQVVGEYAAGKTLEDYLVDEGLHDQIERNGFSTSTISPRRRTPIPFRLGGPSRE